MAQAMECYKRPPKMPSKQGVSQSEIVTRSFFCEGRLICPTRNGPRLARCFYMDQSDGIEACEKRLYLVVIKGEVATRITSAL